MPDAVPRVGAAAAAHIGPRARDGPGRSAEATYESSQFIEDEGCIVVVGNARIVPRSTGAAATVRELHVWYVDDGQLLVLEVFLTAPVPLLAAPGS